uniref:Uncharacterized protein n=1 Tax=Caenorhabditis japonica TaxID=281687 RepID=A0A8R1I3E9_CAEJA
MFLFCSKIQNKASIRTNFRPSGPSVRPSVRRPVRPFVRPSAVRPLRPRFVRFVRGRIGWSVSSGWSGSSVSSGSSGTL